MELNVSNPKALLSPAGSAAGEQEWGVWLLAPVRGEPCLGWDVQRWLSATALPSSQL